MKNKIPQLVMLVALAVVISMGLPSSFAKYSGTENYNLKITKESGFFWNSWDTSAQVVTLPYKGRYAIVAKGGDGANGFYTSGTSDFSTYNIEGGTGGVVSAIIETTVEQQKLYVAPGSAGNRAPQAKAASGQNRAGGTNATGSFSGGSGAWVDGSGLTNYMARLLSQNNHSGGGGAASIVCVGSVYSANSIIMIAGGGGSAGCWNKGYENTALFDTQPAGTGGNAGTSIGTTTSNMKSVSGTISGTVFFGSNGTGEDFTKYGTSYSTYGKAGTVSGGAKGTCRESYGIDTDGNAKGDDFSSGNGGKGACFAGAGGGGYAGGGGGTGTSIAYACGGGGGGSSFIASSLTIDSSNYSTMLTKAMNNTVTGTDKYGNVRNGSIPTQYARSEGYEVSEGESTGFVIIYYLGE